MCQCLFKSSKDNITPGLIVYTDVLDGLSRIKEGTVHLITTSSPFNVNISYPNHDDNMPHDEYLKWMKEVWSACKRVLVKGGRICINIDATMNLEELGLPERVHPLHVDFTNHLRELGYLYRGEVVWSKFNCPGKKTSWGSYTLCSNPHIRRNHEYVLIASKDDLRLEGDHMMCDLTKEEFHEWTLSEWRITPETGEKIHPAPFPRELVKRCIKLFSYVGNTVLDPFNGIGTTTTTAYELGRQYIGIDNCEKYCEIARNKIKRIDHERDITGPYQFVPSPVHVKEAQMKKSNKQIMDIFSV